MAKKKTTSKQKDAGMHKNVPTPIYNTLMVRPLNRGINDIGSWKHALRAADVGFRDRLYDLYEDILIDGVVTDAIDKRIEAITDADINFTINQKPVPEIDALMDTTEFEDLLKEIMLSRFWGISVDELEYNDRFYFNSIPRKHVKPKQKIIIRQQGDQSGINYENDPMVVQWGKDDDLGILFKVAPYVIYKRGGFGDWAQFVELFGMPQRIGKYNSMDDQSRRLLIDAFENAGSAPYLVIPKESEVDTTTLTGSVNGSLYNDFRKACNEELLITILGQTMTSLDGSSRSQSEVHMEVQEKKHRSDRRFVVRMLNRYFRPWLESRGLCPEGGIFSFVDKKDEVNVDELKILSTMVKIPQSYVYNRYGIPLPQGNEDIISQTETSASAQNQEPQKNKEPKNDDIKNSDTGLWERMKSFFASAPIKDGAGTIRMSDDDSLDERVIKSVWRGDCKEFSPELFQFFYTDFLKAIQTSFKQHVNNSDNTITYNAPDDVYLTAMETNLFHFSASKSLAEVEELNKLFRESKSFNEFNENAEKVTDVFNRQWQKTEYITAQLTAEAASNYKRLLKDKDLYPYWVYRTVKDDKVRPKHKKLEGVTLHYSDERWSKIFPPNGWHCRCRVENMMQHEVNGINPEVQKKRVDDYFKTTEWKTDSAQGWGVNRCESAQVFTANQMYINKFPGQASRIFGKMTSDKWGVPSVPKMVSQAKTSIPMTKYTETEVWDANVKGNVIEVRDYKKRVITIEKKQFIDHTTKKGRDNRIKYWDAMLETLESPDEVWINDEIDHNSLDTYNLIKYYKDGAIVANYRIEDDKLMLKSWYVMITNVPEGRKVNLKRVWDKRRRGLYIKR